MAVETSEPAAVGAVTAEFGYSLVGGRLLPREAGPAAHFMYENPTGARLTLYATGTPRDETTFRLFRDGNRRTFYWVDNPASYAMSGPISEGKLPSIAIEGSSGVGCRPSPDTSVDHIRNVTH